MSIVDDHTAPTEATNRAAMIAGLRELADWLEDNPDASVGPFGFARVQYSANSYTPTVAAARAEVDRVAEAIGAEVVLDGTHYRVEKDFGECVTYLALSIDQTDDEQADEA